MITYSSCPCCGSLNIKKALVAKDYTVSKEAFEIWECSVCLLRFTQHIPDADQIGVYYQSDNYISHTDTRKGIINLLYHKVRKRTLKGKRDIINRETNLSSGRLLDIGAGTGAFLSTMKEAGWQTTGLEPDEGSRTRAMENYGLVLQSPDQLFKQASDSADVITMWHVLEHVHELHNYLREIKRILKKDATLLIAVPNYTSYDAAVYNQYWAAYDVPRHLYHFSPESIKTLISDHGMTLVKAKPMWYDSFYVSMLSEQYKKGRPAHISGIFNGLLSNIKTIFNNEKCSSLIYVIRK